MIEHKKYKLLEQGLKAITDGTINLLILKGDAGFSKTYSTQKYLEENKKNSFYLNSYTTPLEFYHLLYQNRNREVIIIDDTQGIGDLKIIAMLKGACWGVINGDRKVSYHTTAKEFEKRNLPSTFDLKANIILIMNESIREFKPILDRGVDIDFKFSFKEKLEIFRSVKKEAKIDDTILDYVALNCTEANKNISIRSLVTLSKLKTSGAVWQDFAEEMFKLNDETQLLIDLVSKCQKIEDACKEWCHETGRSRRTFFRIKKDIIKNETKEK